MPNYVFGNTYQKGDEFITHHGTNHDLQHRVGETIWWTNHAGTISRITPLESPDAPFPNTQPHFDPPLLKGRGFTYIVRWNIE